MGYGPRRSNANDAPRGPRRMRANYPGECKGCGDHFAAGTAILWSKADGARVADCAGCRGDRAEPEAEKVGEVAGILALFEAARKHLKFPKVRLQLLDGTPVVLGVAGPRARYPGSINVTDGGSYGESRFFGRILLDGTFQAGRDALSAGSELIALLGDLAANPAGVAAEYGRLLGSCCFCGLKLTDERSTAMGYGATCAGHWGMPWGAKVAKGDGTVEDRPRRRTRKLVGPDATAELTRIVRDHGLVPEPKDTAWALADGDLL